MTVDMQGLAGALEDLEWWDDAEALRALLAEDKLLREALRIIAEHSTDDGSRQLAKAALDYRQEEVA